MKNKAKIIIAAIIVVVLAVAGTIFYTSKGVNHSNQKVDTPTTAQKVDKLSMKQVAGLTIVYTHLKYRDNTNWQHIYQISKDKKVSIRKYRQYQFSDYMAKAKTGEYVYVLNKEAVFAISNKNKKSKAVVAIGDNKHELGSQKLTTIYKKVFADKQAKKQYQNVVANLDLDPLVSVQKKKKTAASSDDSEDSDSAPTKKIAGDAGEYIIPSQMQGTWYEAEPTIDDDGNETTDGSTHIISVTLKGNTIKNSGEPYIYQLHKVDRKTLPDQTSSDWPQSYANQVRNWAETTPYYDKGSTGFHVFGWGQNMGFGEFYYLTQEEGQTVLIQASGAGAWTNSVYWKTPELAKKNAGKKFDNLDYR